MDRRTLLTRLPLAAAALAGVARNPAAASSLLGLEHGAFVSNDLMSALDELPPARVGTIEVHVFGHAGAAAPTSGDPNRLRHAPPIDECADWEIDL